MYIFVSHKKELENDIWAGSAQCSCCHNISHFHLKKLKNKSYLYSFIPILSYTEKRYIMCDNCGASREMKEKEYREAHKKQMEKLSYGQVPSEIILNDYSPKNLTMVRKWIKFILLMLLILPQVLFSILMPYYLDGYATVILSYLIFLPIGLIPLCFILANFIEAIKKHKAYRKVVNCTYKELAENDKPSESRKNVVKVAIVTALILTFLSPAIASYLGRIAEQKAEIEDPVTEVINEDGVLCDIDIFTGGEIAENAVPVSGKTIVLAGQSYEFPIKVSDLTSNGWKLENPLGYIGNSFTGYVYLGLMSWNGANTLVHESGAKIHLHTVYSETTVFNLTECTISRFQICTDSGTRKLEADFVLPGGITQNSTAADVIQVYGNPNSSKKFMLSKSSEDSFNYSRQEDSQFSYIIQFHKDGTIKQIDVSIP